MDNTPKTAEPQNEREHILQLQQNAVHFSTAHKKCHKPPPSEFPSYAPSFRNFPSYAPSFRISQDMPPPSEFPSYAPSFRISQLCTLLPPKKRQIRIHAPTFQHTAKPFRSRIKMLVIRGFHPQAINISYYI